MWARYSLSAGDCPERVFGPRAPRDAAMRALSPCNCNCLPLLQLVEAFTNVHHCVLGAPESCDILLRQCGCAPICMVVHHCVFPSTALSPGLTMGSVRSRVMCKHTIHTLCTLCAHYMHTLCAHTVHTKFHTVCTLCAHSHTMWDRGLPTYMQTSIVLE